MADVGDHNPVATSKISAESKIVVLFAPPAASTLEAPSAATSKLNLAVFSGAADDHAPAVVIILADQPRRGVRY